MKIEISDCLLSFNGNSIRYASKYLSRFAILGFLRIWKFRLMNLRNGQIVYLPFSIDDECIEAFEAKRNDERVTLKAVKLDGFGFVPGLDSLSDEIEKDRPVMSSATEEFLSCNCNELIDAVVRATEVG